ncbi:MAG: 50S ribosomal protein L29 [Albidovulum sp.]|nr:50S ribosomal protein L29 [Albidovulum sp.]
MKAADLRTKSADELGNELVRLKKESFNLRFQQASGNLSNPSRMREVRRDAARVRTVLGEKSAQADSEREA